MRPIRRPTNARRTTSPVSVSVWTMRRKVSGSISLNSQSVAARALTRLGRPVSMSTSPVNSEASCMVTRISPVQVGLTISRLPESTTKKLRAAAPCSKRISPAFTLRRRPKVARRAICAWVNLGNITSPAVSTSSAIGTLPEKRALLQFFEGLAQFLLRVHYDRSIPGNRLLEGLARNQQEAHAVFAGLDLHFVAAVEQYERAILGLRGRRGIQPIDHFGRHGERAGGIAEFAAAREDVSEGVAGGLDGQRPSAPGRHGHVEINRVGCDAVHRASLTPEAAADHAHAGAVVVGGLGDVAGFHFLIARRRHFQRGRK